MPTEEVHLWLSFAPAFQQPPPLKSSKIQKQGTMLLKEMDFEITHVMVLLRYNFICGTILVPKVKLNHSSHKKQQLCFGWQKSVLGLGGGEEGSHNHSNFSWTILSKGGKVQ